MSLRWNDAVTTLLVAALGTLSWAYFTDRVWPLFSGPRVLAVTAFVVGVLWLATTLRRTLARDPGA